VSQSWRRPVLDGGGFASVSLRPGKDRTESLAGIRRDGGLVVATDGCPVMRLIMMLTPQPIAAVAITVFQAFFNNRPRVFRPSRHRNLGSSYGEIERR